MGSEGYPKDSVVTQVSIAGIPTEVRAIDLMNFLEAEIGGQVWRCRLKTSWTPPEAYPDFNASTDMIQPIDGYASVEPHAFVHFASPLSATSCYDASKRNALVFDGQCLKVSLGPESPYRLNQRRRTTTPFKLTGVHLDIGSQVTRDEFYVGWEGSQPMDFFVDPFDDICRFCFTRPTAFCFKDRGQYAVIRCDFKMEFLSREILEVKQYKEMSHLVVVLRLASSPLLYYRTADDDIEQNVPFDLLDDEDPWIRATDFTPSGAIGRYNMFRVLVPPRRGPKLMNALKYLRERRVNNVSLRRPLKICKEPDYGVPQADVLFSVHEEGVPFEVMFLLNAAVHKNVVNQHQMTKEFFELLRTCPMDLNVAALKNICTYKHPVVDAFKTLMLVQQGMLKNPKYFMSPRLLEDVVEVRRLVITPTKCYCLPPATELSNRVLRRYKDVSDRFLRVTFMDEGMQTMNAHILNYYPPPVLKEVTPKSSGQRTMIFKRLKAIMNDGFYLCGRKFSFLAFSSNQLRDRSAWFFAENREITVNKVIEWMGKFHNKNVAKCAARMGQCFSSTYATVEVPLRHANQNLPDVKRNNYVFSDGIGMIAPDLALQVAEKLKLDVNPPSAYQIRYAGFKGVVACWPGKDVGFKLSLRESMNKFFSTHAVLEICSWTRFQPGFLNRQIITLLSALDVKDEIFWDMQQTMVSKVNEMLTDPDIAFDVVTSSCAEQGNTAALMLTMGLKPQAEPHLRGMLACIRAAQLWGLREKSRIFVPSGRWLMGCLDELAVLEQGQCFIQVSNPAIENCFIKHGSKFSEVKKNFEVIKGYVVIAKNPCLHPGDVRILEAVDKPGLHHLVDCLVFPQKGDRPHTDEASGSDLDGDLYFVTWDENLIPPSKKSWTPMLYDPAKARELPRKVSHQDIIDFFVQHILNENLGAICNAHVVHADSSESGAHDENCLHLAKLAAIAVDFPKTGKLALMPPHLKPKLYPDFMGKEPYQSYKSTKILGRLYRQIKDGYDEELDSRDEPDCVPGNIPYDTSLFIPGSERFMLDAWDQKCSYDRQLAGLLGQYKVNREEEVVTGHVWSMPKYVSRKQSDLKERLKHSYTSLRKEFRNIFEKLDSDVDPEQITEEERNSMYEQKASAWYQVTYHPEWVKKSADMLELDSGGNRTVMLSFAWIAADFIARVKIKKQGREHVDGGAGTKPINMLRSYVADRI
ncbi:hypothetical protein MLD38_007086 [Melastoma candidum]|uniref:Uncharacterized protein n=1 Tax=Melastoma candidum TaxID=119954 RepID=A0ACB9RT01_9MYRT|nr:hypothetical protein MLD38_007086 [Melastoma candidum]